MGHHTQVLFFIMTIQKQIQDALLTARRNKSKGHIVIYGVILGEFDRSDFVVDKKVTDEIAIKILTKVKKGAKSCFDLDTVAMCNKYLPSLLTEGDIKAKLLYLISTQGIKTFPAAFGRIMGEFNKLYKGKADNNLVAKVVKEILNSENT